MKTERGKEKKKKKKEITNPNPFHMVDAQLHLTLCLRVYVSLLTAASSGVSLVPVAVSVISFLFYLCICHY